MSCFSSSVGRLPVSISVCIHVGILAGCLNSSLSIIQKQLPNNFLVSSHCSPLIIIILFVTSALLTIQVSVSVAIKDSGVTVAVDLVTIFSVSLSSQSLLAFSSSLLSLTSMMKGAYSSNDECVMFGEVDGEVVVSADVLPIGASSSLSRALCLLSVRLLSARSFEGCGRACGGFAPLPGVFCFARVAPNCSSAFVCHSQIPCTNQPHSRSPST